MGRHGGEMKAATGNMRGSMKAVKNADEKKNKPLEIPEKKLNSAIIARAISAFAI